MQGDILSMPFKSKSIDGIWNLGVIAPMIGLLGTVLGISLSFGTLNLRAGFTDPIELVGQMATGINYALFTTIAGLVVGVSFLLAYYLLKAQISRIESDLLLLADVAIRKTFVMIVEGNLKVTLS